LILLNENVFVGIPNVPAPSSLPFSPLVDDRVDYLRGVSSHVWVVPDLLASDEAAGFAELVVTRIV